MAPHDVDPGSIDGPRFADDIGADDGRLQCVCDEIGRQGRTNVVMDVSGAEIGRSANFGRLVYVWKRVREAGGVVHIWGASPTAERLLDSVVPSAEALRHFDSEEAAIRAFGA